MNNTTICPNCGVKLRFPDVSGRRNIRCGACKYVFEIPQTPVANINKPFRKKRSLWLWPPIFFSIVGVIIIGILVIILKPRSVIEKSSNVLTNAKENIPTASAKWINISYDELIDKTQLTQPGEPLSAVINKLGNSQSARGFVQPFLGPQASLLIDVLDMIQPSSGAPWINIGNYFEPGSEQPAWAALMRGGEVLVAATGDERARVFVPGKDPQTAYQSYYGIVRHALNGLLPENGNKLSVEVFAFENIYEKCELLLNEVPYVFAATSFPPPNGKRDLDLEGLEQFLQEGVVLEGGSLSKTEGLVLYGRKSGQQTLMGRPISIADLAVAYRSVFHAGDNSAFISLDANMDPTKTTVNFGGFLEDTAIGAVVLEADKRFKTISTGLDPNTYRDLRNVIRTKIPDFKTSDELEISEGYIPDQGSWVGTRFWFYPESVKVETDFDGLYARIINAQFTADAERSREDYADAAQFEALKKQQLSPSIRKAIDHLNGNYSSYAQVFPELRELLVVGRLIGLMSWLNGVDASPVDLDALLAIPLPAFRTDREKTQLMTATVVSHAESFEKKITGRIITSNLTPILEASVKTHYREINALATYLALRSGGKKENSQQYLQEAEHILHEKSQSPVSSLIKTKDDIQALADEAAGRINAPEPEFILRKENDLIRIKSALKGLENEIEKIKLIMDRDAETHNRNLNQHNKIVDEFNTLRDQYNYIVAEINSYKIATMRIVEIGGGISLRPKEFSVIKRVDSPAVSEMRSKALVGMTKLENMAPLGSWIRTRIGSRQVYRKSSLSKFKAVSIQSRNISNRILGEGDIYGLGKYWQAKEIGDGSWRDQINKRDGVQRERYYNSSDVAFHIIERSHSGVKNHIIARKVAADRIIFTKENQQNIVDPGTPPFWYEIPAPIKYP